jgi:hypothetical protein
MRGYQTRGRAKHRLMQVFESIDEIWFAELSITAWKLSRSLLNPGLDARRFISAQLSDIKCKTLCLHMMRGKKRWRFLIQDKNAGKGLYVPADGIQEMLAKGSSGSAIMHSRPGSQFR